MAAPNEEIPAGEERQLSSQEQEALIEALRDKLGSLSFMREHQEYLANLPEAVRGRVQQLAGLQQHHSQLEEQFREEQAALERKYAGLYAPLYTQRRAIIAGEEGEQGQGPKGIPGFWLRVLTNCPEIADTITEKDEKVLSYLTDVSTSLVEEEKGSFQLTFEFGENPYFSNKTLTKVYHMASDSSEPILEKITGCDIEWAAGKDVTVKVLKKKPKKAGLKPIIKTEPCESFFRFFAPPEIPDEDEEMEDEEIRQLQEVMEEDYEMGALMRERIVPNALGWFTGEALLAHLEGEFDEYSEGEEDEEDDDEEDDDDVDDDESDDGDDDDDEEDDEPAPAKKGKTKGKGKGGKAATDSKEQPPECKQQ